MSVHEFSCVTNRLKQSTRTHPLYPLSPRTLQSTELPAMMYEMSLIKPVKVQSPIKGKFSTLPPKIAELQKKFQADMTKPVYLMGGMKDRILFRFTVAGTAACFVINMYYLYQGSKK